MRYRQSALGTVLRKTCSHVGGSDNLLCHEHRDRVAPLEQILSRISVSGTNFFLCRISVFRVSASARLYFSPSLLSLFSFKFSISFPPRVTPLALRSCRFFALSPEGMIVCARTHHHSATVLPQRTLTSPYPPPSPVSTRPLSRWN